MAVKTRARFVIHGGSRSWRGQLRVPGLRTTAVTPRGAGAPLAPRKETLPVALEAYGTLVFVW